MIDTFLGVVLLIGVATLAVAIGALRSSRRSERLGEDCYELLRDQQERLEMLREERRMLTEELERESRERRQLTEYLEETDPRLRENLERRRRARVEDEREIEGLAGRPAAPAAGAPANHGGAPAGASEALEVQQRAEQLERPARGAIGS